MSEAPAPSNGNGQVKRDLAVVWTLAGIVASIAAIAGLSIFQPPAQWDLVDKVVDGLFILSNTLAGGLLVKTRSGG